MNDRVHEALDGTLERRDLTLAEGAEVERLQSASDAVADHLAREDVPDLTASVMRELDRRSPSAASAGSANAASPRGGGWLRSLWQPRELRIRPVWGLLAAAAVVGLVVLPRGGEVPGPPSTNAEAIAEVTASASGSISTSTSASAGADEPMTVLVQFRLHAPNASEVRLAGSFTAWEPRYLLNDAGEGIWTLLVPMEPGIHDYAFVIDGGTWVSDPAAPRVDDGFGGENSRLALLPPNGVRES